MEIVSEFAKLGMTLLQIVGLNLSCFSLNSIKNKTNVEQIHQEKTTSSRKTISIMSDYNHYLLCVGSETSCSRKLENDMKA